MASSAAICALSMPLSKSVRTAGSLSSAVNELFEPSSTGRK